MLRCHSCSLGNLASTKSCSPLLLPPGLGKLANLAPIEVHRKLLLTQGLAACLCTCLTVAVCALRKGTGRCYLFHRWPDFFLEMSHQEGIKKQEWTGEVLTPANELLPGVLEDSEESECRSTGMEAAFVSGLCTTLQPPSLLPARATDMQLRSLQNLPLTNTAILESPFRYDFS